MKIDYSTMSFVNMTDAEAAEVMAMAESIMLHGKVPHPFPEHIERWMAAFGFGENQRLLMISTAYVQRALFSVARHYAAKMGAHEPR